MGSRGWGDWNKGDRIDTKAEVTPKGDLRIISRGAQHRGNKDDYPHMTVTVDLQGNVKNAHWSENENDHIGTKTGEWAKNPDISKSGPSDDTPSYNDYHSK